MLNKNMCRSLVNWQWTRENQLNHIYYADWTTLLAEWCFDRLNWTSSGDGRGLNASFAM